MARARLSNASDEELLLLAGEDPEAFGAFYDRLEGEVLGFLQRATGRSDIAADLTAEVFASALQSATRFDPGLGTARAWLFGIARHELADTWKRGRVADRARRSLEIEALVLSDAALERIERELGGGATEALELLGELPDEQRAAIEGRVLEDRDYADLAASLACSASVVRQRVSRGLRSLRARMEQTR